MSLIIFTHANSFGASTYRVLFRGLRARGFTVKAIEKIGHDPAYPVSNNWPHLVRQLAAFAGPEIESVGEGAWLVGHSLGGYLSTLLAARHPVLGSHTIKGVVLLDSPLVGGWKARALQFAKSTPLIEQVSPSRVSRTRRTHWPSREDALASFASKKAFARWQPQVLKDYIQHGLVEDKGRFRLAFDRAVETAIYNTVPHHFDGYLKRHPLQCPLAFVGGQYSRELRQVGGALTEQIAQGRMSMMAGSHLFPMEHPLETAAEIERVIGGMRSS